MSESVDKTVDLCMQDALTALATTTKAALDAEVAKLTTTDDTNYADLKAQIDALAGDDELANKLAALSNLVKTLDLDSDDSIVDGLTEALALAQQALDAANLADTNAAAAKQAADDVNAALTQFKTEYATTISGLDSRLTTVEESLAALKTCCDNSITKAEVESLIKANNTTICNGLLLGVEAFKSILGGTSDDTGGGDAGGGDIV